MYILPLSEHFLISDLRVFLLFVVCSSDMIQDVLILSLYIYMHSFLAFTQPAINYGTNWQKMEVLGAHPLRLGVSWHKSSTLR